MKLFKVAAAVLLLATQSFPSLADVAFRERLIFAEYNDPGWMKLKDEDGNEVTADFYYSLILHNDISAWEAGEEMAVILDAENGIQLQRNKNGMKYTVIFSDDADPVSKRLKECLSAEQIDTYVIAECHSEAGTYYERTANSLYQLIAESGDEQLSTALAIEQQSWELYQETRNAAIRQYLADKFGTIQIILNANDYSLQMKNRLDSLVRFLE